MGGVIRTIRIRSMPEPSTFQRSIADFCEATAQWRRRKADEYDRDERNLRTADALHAFGAFVHQLVVNDLNPFAHGGEILANPIDAFRGFAQPRPVVSL